MSQSTEETGFLPELRRLGPSETSQARAHHQNKTSIPHSPLTTTTTSGPIITPKPFPLDQGFRQRPPAPATHGHHTAHSFPHTEASPSPAPPMPSERTGSRGVQSAAAPRPHIPSPPHRAACRSEDTLHVRHGGPAALRPGAGQGKKASAALVPSAGSAAAPSSGSLHFR